MALKYSGINKEEKEKGYALLSGGKDSTLAAYEMHLQGRLEGVVFIETGIGLTITKEYVTMLSQKFGWNLYISQGYTDYSSYVLKHGFPHKHSNVMHILKADAIRRFISSRKKLGIDPIILFSGVRATESKNRARWVQPRSEKWGAIWENPIRTLTSNQVWDKLKEYGIPLNSAYETIGRSGDCLCGAFSTDSEKLLIAKFHPEIYNKIVFLEENTESKYNTWGRSSGSMCNLKAQTELESFICSECSLEETLKPKGDGE